MWVTQVILIVVGLSAGFVVASGLASFIIGLGIVSKFADRTKTGKHVMLYEDMIALGGILGSIVFIYQMPLNALAIFMPVVGISAGVFVGCWAVSIAEVINIFPILMRRVKLVLYIKYIVLFFALGKGVGMFVMFLVNK